MSGIQHLVNSIECDRQAREHELSGQHRLARWYRLREAKERFKAKACRYFEQNRPSRKGS